MLVLSLEHQLQVMAKEEEPYIPFIVNTLPENTLGCYFLHYYFHFHLDD